MKLQVRCGVFETNSSSTHSLVICTADEYRRFKCGDLLYDVYNDCLVSVDSVEGDDEYRYRNAADVWDMDWVEDTFMRGFETPSGDSIVVFGAFGRDG
jgi:hypothetical protein